MLQKLSVCVCSLRYTACAIFSSVAYPALQDFSTICHKRHDFRRKVTEHKMFILIFSTTLPETFRILIINERHMILKNLYWSSRKIPLFLSDFNET